jgi:hypothetical protein
MEQRKEHVPKTGSGTSSVQLRREIADVICRGGNGTLKVWGVEADGVSCCSVAATKSGIVPSFNSCVDSMRVIREIRVGKMRERGGEEGKGRRVAVQITRMRHP